MHNETYFQSNLSYTWISKSNALYYFDLQIVIFIMQCFISRNMLPQIWLQLNR